MGPCSPFEIRGCIKALCNIVVHKKGSVPRVVSSKPSKILKREKGRL